MQQQQLQQLKGSSLLLEEGTPVIWPSQEEPGTLKVSKIIHGLEGQKVYAFNAKVIAYVDDGEFYVTPNTKDALSTIRNAGFNLREFFVPFSRGDRPIGDLGAKWQELLAKTGLCTAAPLTA